MMNRTAQLLLLAAATLVACSSDSLGLQEVTPQDNQRGPMPVSFSAYTTRNTTRNTTRSGATGTLTTAGLTTPSTDFGRAGFGVFACYTGADDYASDARPNFMFNQQVAYDKTHGVFDYAPTRYWPNEHGPNAASEDIDKVSFFAYAPYVEVTPATGYLANPGEGNSGATWGITGTSRNTYTGDPIVKYIAAFQPDRSVDLCWGVYNEGASGWATMNGRQTTTDGLPWLNVQRAQSEDQRLRFTFRHATAQLNVQIDANFDGQSTAADAATKIYVRSITFTGMAAQGALNLCNVQPGVPLWMNYTGTGPIENGQSVTIHDGLRDGYEGTASAEATGETTRGLNPWLIGNPGNTTPGVTGTAVNLFGRYQDNTDISQGICVIPTGERVRMTIVYDVETAVPTLSGLLSDGKTHGLSIENRITTDLYHDGGPLVFAGGKSYTLRLHLGMNSVKLDATVDETWEKGDDISVPEQAITLATITQQNIDNNRGTTEKPRAWVICEDGHLHLCQGGKEVDPLSSADAPTYWSTATSKLRCGKKKVAVVCYVGEPGSVDKSAGSSGYHGLAIAIEDAETASSVNDFTWFTNNDDPACAPVYAVNDNTTPIPTTDDAYLKGIDNTIQLGTPAGTCLEHTHDAAYQALHYGDNEATYSDHSHKRPGGASQWFLPTISQWSLMVQGLTGDNAGLYCNKEYDNYKKAVIEKYLDTAAGGRTLGGYNWSCTEDVMGGDTHYAWIMNFDRGCALYHFRTSKAHVRPVIAF